MTAREAGRQVDRHSGDRRKSVPRMLLRVIVPAVGAAVVVLALIAAVPFALREGAADGAVRDTAAALPGQAQRVSDSLRRLGYSCSDVVEGPGTTTRSCSRVEHLTTSRVGMVLTTTSGTLELAAVTTDDEQHAPEIYREAVAAVGPALDLPRAAQDRATAAAGSSVDTTVDLGWGSLTVKTALPASAEESGATLRSATGATASLGASRTTLDVPVDVFAAGAQAHGYTCSTPQVDTIRACEKGDSGYHEELSFQGIDRYTTEIYLSVTSTYHRQTRAHWIEAMSEVVGWADTGQTKALRAWLDSSQDAPGATAYVDGLPIYFLVRNDTYTKETFGGLRADCATRIEDLSSCDNRTTAPGRPG